MSLTYGFYNSLNGDRKYNAEQMASIFNGIINDGIFASIGDCLMVKPNVKMSVNIGTGRAWFNGTWTFNDSNYPVDISPSDPILCRIDLVVLEINKNTRENKIIVIEGTPATLAVTPSWKKGEDGMIYQYPLASVRVEPGATVITASNITNWVGGNTTPFVTGILESVSTDELIVQWQAQFEEWFSARESEFENWIDSLRDVLDEETATNLYNRILELEKDVDVSNRTTCEALDQNNVVLIDGDKKISAKDLFFKTQELIYNTAGSQEGAAAAIHRSHYRGKFLGQSVTAEQIAAIKAGTFEDLWLGDYWNINNVFWRIVDFDYWYHYGDGNDFLHHVVVMPDMPLYYTYMNATNTTDGGYADSNMRTSGLYNAKTIIENAFGDYIIQHREYLVNAVTDGHPSGGAWYHSEVEIPNEIMIFGSHIFAPNSDGSIDVSRHTIDHTQLALFASNRGRIAYGIATDTTYWLRDVVNAVRFAFVSANGEASYTNASNKRGVRPVFAVGSRTVGF